MRNLSFPYVILILTESFFLRIPVGWGQFESLMENSSAHQSWNDSSQLSFNGSGYPWEKLIPKHPSIQVLKKVPKITGSHKFKTRLSRTRS